MSNDENIKQFSEKATPIFEKYDIRHTTYDMPVFLVRTREENKKPKAMLIFW